MWWGLLISSPQYLGPQMEDYKAENWNCLKLAPSHFQQSMLTIDRDIAGQGLLTRTSTQDFSTWPGLPHNMLRETWTESVFF